MRREPTRSEIALRSIQEATGAPGNDSWEGVDWMREGERWNCARGPLDLGELKDEFVQTVALIKERG
jgi:hypothetical protein